MDMAQRIRARAIRRAGELLKQIEAGSGAHRKTEGDHSFSRTDAARDGKREEGDHLPLTRTAAVMIECKGSRRREVSNADVAVP